MPKKINKTELSMDEEMMMWCAYRYAIGRHTYVVSLADYIAKNYYDKLSEDRLEFTSKDIIDCINDQLNFGSLSIHYDGSVPYEERNAFEDLMLFMQENISCEDDLSKYEKIEIYKESYAKDAPKKVRVHTCMPIKHSYHSSMDFDDLIPWYTLASFFNKKNYKIVHTNYNGKEEDHICFETWRRSSEEIPNEPGYYRIVPYKYEKCYYSVDNYKEKGNYSGYIVNEYIISVEDYKV